MRTNNKFSKVEILIAAAVLCVVSVITLPKFSQASADDRLNTLCNTLQSVRSQLTLYNIQHDGRWPRQTTFAEQMTRMTNLKGSAEAGDGALTFGPYLESIPVNPFTGGNSVTGGDWRYDDKTGKFVADAGGTTRGIRQQ
jgi:type II secretory pathway pseudopilin PulG